MRALILLAAIAGLYLAFRWFLTQPRRTQLQATAVTVGLALIGLAATGRLNWVFAIFGALLPFVRRLLPLLSYLPTFQRVFRHFKSAQSTAGQSAGQQSKVETRFVSMTHQHKGEFAIELPMLIGHKASNDLFAEALHFVAHAQKRLDLLLAAMKG